MEYLLRQNISFFLAVLEKEFSKYSRGATAFSGDHPKKLFVHFCPQPTNSDSGELFSMKLFVYIDG